MRRIVGAALIAVGLSGAALADNAGTAQEQAACRPDVRKLCSHVGAGDDKYRECLQAHFAELSPKCQEVLASHKN